MHLAARLLLVAREQGHEEPVPVRVLGRRDRAKPRFRRRQELRPLLDVVLGHRPLHRLLLLLLLLLLRRRAHRVLQVAVAPGRVRPDSLARHSHVYGAHDKHDGDKELWA